MIYREIEQGEIIAEYEGTPEEITSILKRKKENVIITSPVITYNALVDKRDLIECIANGIDMHYMRQRQGTTKTTV